MCDTSVYEMTSVKIFSVSSETCNMGILSYVTLPCHSKTHLPILKLYLLKFNFFKLALGPQLFKILYYIPSLSLLWIQLFFCTKVFTLEILSLGLYMLEWMCIWYVTLLNYSLMEDSTFIISFLPSVNFISVFVCVNVLWRTCKARAQLPSVSSLLPSGGLWESNLGWQACGKCLTHCAIPLALSLR